MTKLRPRGYSDISIDNRPPLFRDHRGRYVMFDAEGPGRLESVSVLNCDELSAALDGIEQLFVPTKPDAVIQWAKALTVVATSAEARFTGVHSPFPCDERPQAGLGDIPAPCFLEEGLRYCATDRIDPCDEDSRRAHRLTAQNESEIFELSGRRHRSHLNRMSFDVAIDPLNVGVLIRRVYDRFHGRQRARVLVDGVAVGYWYSPVENRANRWAEDEFFLPDGYTLDKELLRLEIDPPAGTPLWDVAEYRVFSLLGAE